MPQLLVILPMGRASECASVAQCFDGIADCQVTVDRRRGERRTHSTDAPVHERRRGERRSSNLEASCGLVVLVH